MCHGHAAALNHSNCRFRLGVTHSPHVAVFAGCLLGACLGCCRRAHLIVYYLWLNRIKSAVLVVLHCICCRLVLRCIQCCICICCIATCFCTCRGVLMDYKTVQAWEVSARSSPTPASR